MPSETAQFLQPTFQMLFGHSPVVMDGGLGTTLEAKLGPSVSHSPLWSAHALARDPEALINAHLRYLEAGAQVISTATYQCSPETFNRAGFTTDEGNALMIQAVRLAHEAVAAFDTQTATSIHGTMRHAGQNRRRPAFVALSLGPLGATLSPTQEFHAYYPPPYGPRAYTQDGENTNRYSDSDEERAATDALAHFHFKRLAVFAADAETWDYVSCIAFETVPLRREVTAIRRAMTWLQQKFVAGKRGDDLKPWWISCVFPNGESPEEASSSAQAKAQIEDFLDAAFRNEGAAADYLAVPLGFGVNCTSAQYIRQLSPRIVNYFKTLDEKNLPWLVLYPNGTDIYDEASQTWVPTGKDAKEWADDLAGVVEMQDIGPQRLLLGGCCRTGPKEIASLDRVLATKYKMGA